MKKLINFLLVAIIATAGCFSAIGCKSSEAAASTRLTAEINPKIEFLLDTDNKVISVSGLNEEGELIISGSLFTGLNAEDAVALFIEIATDSGYLLEGEAYLDENLLSLSVSGDKDAAEKLFDKINKKAKEKFDALGLFAKIEQTEPFTLEELKELVLKFDSTLKEEDVADLTEEELIKLLAEIRKETKDLVGLAVKEAYNKVKAYEIKKAENVKFKEIVEEFSETASEAEKFVAEAYLTALENLEAAKKTLSETYYSLFVDETSVYQTALREFLEKKKAALELRKEISREADEQVKEYKQSLLDVAEQALSIAENALETAKTNAEKIIDGLCNAVSDAEKSLQDAYDSLISILPGLKATIEEREKDLEKAIKDAKDNMHNRFEEAYGDRIKDIKEMYRHKQYV